MPNTNVTIIYLVRALAQKMEPGEEIHLPRDLMENYGPDQHHLWMGTGLDVHYVGEEVVIRKLMTYS